MSEDEMMDASFLAELRAWAREGAAEFERVYRATGPNAVTDDVALVAYRRCTALDTLLTTRLDGERSRLVAALEDAERAARALPGERHALLMAYQEGDAPKSAAEWDRIVAAFDATANRARMRVGEAWEALQAFDAATAGGE